MTDTDLSSEKTVPSALSKKRPPRVNKHHTAPAVVIKAMPPLTTRQTARMVNHSDEVQQALLQLLPAIKLIADDELGYTLLYAVAHLCADHPNSMATLWDTTNRSFAASPPLLHVAARAIAEAAPEYALGCWRSLATAEQGQGNATTEYAKALVLHASKAVGENKVAEAVSALHELRGFGAASGNYQWLHEGLPLLAQLNFSVGNQTLGLDQYKSFRQTLPRALGDDRVFPSRVHALTQKPETNTPSETMPVLVVPQFMPRVDFGRIGSKATFEPTIDVLPYATVVPSCIVGSHVQAVLTQERELLIDQFNLHPRYYIAKESSFIRAISPDEHALVDLAYHPLSRFLPGDHVLLGGAPNYYHWLFEYLPRMKAVLSERIKFDSLLVNSGFQSFQNESLQILLGGNQALTFLNTNTTYTCERLHVPTLRPYSEAIGFLRETFLNGRRGGAPRRKLFVSRGDAHPSRSRIANEDEVYAAIEREGYERVLMSTLNFREQVNLFSEAKVIIAAHGAALTNTVFAPPDCAVFEINNQINRSYKFFEDIAVILGQPFHRIVFDGKTSVGFHEEDAACEVDVGVLLERIKQ